MGQRIEANEATAASSIRPDKIIEVPKLTLLNNATRFDKPRETEVIEFVKLLENTEYPVAMKALLLKILNSKKTEELKQALESKSNNVIRLKKKGGRSNQLSTSNHEGYRRQFVRRTSKSKLLDQQNGSTNKGEARKSLRNKSIEPGSRAKVPGSSPGSNLRRSRQSDSCLRKMNADSSNQKSKLTSSASLLHVGKATRRRRSLVKSNQDETNQGESQAEKNNASWTSESDAATRLRSRSSTGSFLKSMPMSPGCLSPNANWDSALSPPRDRKAVNKLRLRSLAKASDKIDLIGDDSGRDEDKPRTAIDIMKDSKLMNTSFAQFSPNGQVAYLEQSVRLTDLVNDPRSSSRSIISNNDSVGTKSDHSDDSVSGSKKGIRKYLGRRKDKQPVSSDSTNETYASLADDNTSIASSALQDIIASS